MDLKRHSLPELRQLQLQIAKEIERRKAASRVSLLKRLRRLAREEGVALDEVIASAASPVSAKGSAGRRPKAQAPAPKQPLPAKYRHPNNRELAWSGRGRRPQWVDAWLANGGAMDALAIAAEKLQPKTAPRSS